MSPNENDEGPSEQEDFWLGVAVVVLVLAAGVFMTLLFWYVSQAQNG